MASLRQLGNQEVTWEVKGFGREIVLQQGGQQVGTLKIVGAGRSCRAECADGAWEFKFLDAFGNKFGISMVTATDKKGKDTLTPIGEMNAKMMRSGRLVLADGHAFQWKVEPKSAEWFEDGSNVLYVRYARTGGKRGMLVIAPAIAAEATTPAVALFGLWLTYLVMFASN